MPGWRGSPRASATDTSSVAGRSRARSTALDEIVIATVADPGDHVAEVLAAERHASVRSAVHDLPEPYREVVSLRFFGELTLAEIAASTGRPLGTVKAQLYRGLDRLRGTPWRGTAVNAGPPFVLRSDDPDIDAHPLTPILERYIRETAISPHRDLVARIVAGIEAAPPPIRPSSFIDDLTRLRWGAALGDLRDMGRTVFERGVPALVRAQAFALLLLVTLTVGTVGAVGAATIGPIVHELVRPARSNDDGPQPPSVRQTQPVREAPSRPGDAVAPEPAR